MIIMANWWESALKSGMGEKFADIATAPIPVGPHGDKPHSISYSWMTVVNAEGDLCGAEGGLGVPVVAERAEVGSKPAAPAMGEILISMGILPSRSSDTAAFADTA